MLKNIYLILSLLFITSVTFAQDVDYKYSAIFNVEDLSGTQPTFTLKLTQSQNGSFNAPNQFQSSYNSFIVANVPENSIGIDENGNVFTINNVSAQGLDSEFDQFVTVQATRLNSGTNQTGANSTGPTGKMIISTPSGSCNLLSTVPENETGASPKLIAYLENYNEQLTQQCIDSLKSNFIELPADEPVAGLPTTSDVLSYVSTRPFYHGTTIYYIGTGTTEEPEGSWLIDDDGSVVNNYVQNITNNTIEISPVDPTNSISVIAALPSPCPFGQIVWDGGTAENPDYAWKVTEDLLGDCSVIEIESPATSENHLVSTEAGNLLRNGADNRPYLDTIIVCQETEASSMKAVYYTFANEAIIESTVEEANVTYANLSNSVDEGNGVLKQNKTVSGWGGAFAESIETLQGDGIITFKLNKDIVNNGSGWNGGASSVQIIPANTAGYIEYNIDELTKEKSFGLSEIDENNSFDATDFSIMITALNELKVYEDGVTPVNNGAFSTNAVVKIERTVAGQVNYYKDNTLFHTSANSSTAALVADVSLNYSGGSFRNVVINNGSTTENVNWTNLSESVYIPVVEPNNLYKAINSNAVILGAKYEGTSPEFYQVPYAFRINPTNTIQVYENNQVKGNFGTFNKDTPLSMRRNGLTMDYYLGENFLYSSEAVSLGQLRDKSNYELGTELCEAKDQIDLNFERLNSFKPLSLGENLLAENWTISIDNMIDKLTGEEILLLSKIGESNTGFSASNDSLKVYEAMPRQETMMFANSNFETLHIGVNQNLKHNGGDITKHSWENEWANYAAMGVLDKKLFLTHHGQGGSKIEEWEVGDLYWTSFVAEWIDIKAALEDSLYSYDPVFPVSLGINDANSGTDKAVFKAGLKDLITRIRQEVGFPNARFILTEILVFTTPEYIAINDALKEIADEDAYIEIVQTEGLAKRDLYHWNYHSTKTIARRMMAKIGYTTSSD